MKDDELVFGPQGSCVVSLK